MNKNKLNTAKILKSSILGCGLLFFPMLTWAGSKGRFVGGATPEFEKVFNAVASLPLQLLTLARYGSMIAGLFIMFAGLFFWGLHTQRLSGKQVTWVHFDRLPSAGGCIGMLFIGAFFWLLGMDFLGLAIGVNTLGGDTESVYSVVKYSSTKSVTEMLNALIVHLVKSIGWFLGFVTYVSIGNDMYKNTLQQETLPVSKIVAKAVVGACFASIITINDWIGNTIGFNILRFLF